MIYSYSWCPDDGSCKKMVRVLFPLIFDATTEYIADYVSSSYHYTENLPKIVKCTATKQN